MAGPARWFQFPVFLAAALLLFVSEVSAELYPGKGDEVSFAYSPPTPQEKVTTLRRMLRRFVEASSQDSFGTAPSETVFRSRLMHTSTQTLSPAKHVVLENSQESAFAGGDWAETDPLFKFPKGTYHIEEDGSRLTYQTDDAADIEPLTQAQEASAKSYFSGPPLYQRFGQYIDGRSFTVGKKLSPGAGLAAVLGRQNAENVVLELANVGLRRGRDVARFRIAYSFVADVPVSVHLLVDVDRQSGRALRVIETLRTEAPTRANNDSSWVHLIYTTDREYWFDSQRLDRTNTEVVNPAFLSAAGSGVADMAYVPESGSLILLQETTRHDETHQMIGIWNVNTQAVTKVQNSDFGSRLFSSAASKYFVQTSEDLAIAGFTIVNDGFNPFGNFLRYSTEQKFSAWDMLGPNAVVGTNQGEIGFINVGWDQDRSLQVSDHPITGVSVSPDRKTLASLDSKGMLELRSLLYPQKCGARDFLEVFCEDAQIDFGPLKHSQVITDGACAKEIGPTLRLGADAATIIYTQHAPEKACSPTGQIIALKLADGTTRAFPGRAFALNLEGDHLITEFGSAALGADTPEMLWFDRPVDGVTKIVLAQEYNLAFLRTRSGKVHLVDLTSRTVLDEITSQAGFRAPTHILARSIAHQKFVSLASDGTLVFESPETNQRTFASLGGLLPAKERLVSAKMHATHDGWLVAARSNAQAHLFKIDSEERVVLLARTNAPEADINQGFAARGDRAILLGHRKLISYSHGQVTVASLQVLQRARGVALATGRFEGAPLLVTQKPSVLGLRTELILGQIKDGEVATIRAYTLQEQYSRIPHPIAVHPEGRFIAVANLQAAKGGHWNENARIIKVLDLWTGKWWSEAFSGWGGDATMSYSHDGETLVVGKESGQLVLLDPQRGRKIATLEAHSGAVTDLAWNNGRLISRGQDSLTKIWQLEVDDLDGFFTAPFDLKFGSPIGGAEDGRLAATLFDPMLDRDTRRFEGTVVLTPDGYYAGDKNRVRHLQLIQGGAQSLDLSQADLHRNRPEVVLPRADLISDKRRKVLARLHAKRLRENGSPQAANQTNRPDDGLAAQITFQLVTPPVTRVAKAQISLSAAKDLQFASLDIRNNGIVVKRLQAAEVSDGHLFDLPLTPGPNRIQLTAQDDTQNDHILARATVRYEALMSEPPPELFVFAVGVSDYMDSSLDLEYAAKDARDLAAFLAKHAGARVKIATDGAATSDIIQAAQQFFAQARPQDRTLFFFAGHGLLDKEYRYFLGSHETQLEDIPATALSFSALETVFDQSASLNRAIFLDACHSGAVDPELQSAPNRGFRDEAIVVRSARSGVALRKTEKETATLEESYEVLRASFLDPQSRSGASIISASGGLQFAFENQRVSNGLFTHAVLEGLQSGQADANQDGQTELEELFHYVRNRVTSLSDGRQVPSVRSEPLYGRFVLSSKGVSKP